MKNAVIYARVNSRSQIDDGGLEIQKQLCRDYCKKSKLKVRKIFSDTGESALNMRREGLVKLLEYLEKNRFTVDYVVVYTMDRLLRNMMNAFSLGKTLRSLDVKVKTIGEPIIENSPTNSYKLLISFANFAKRLNM